LKQITIIKKIGLEIFNDDTRQTQNANGGRFLSLFKSIWIKTHYKYIKNNQMRIDIPHYAELHNLFLFSS